MLVLTPLALARDRYGIMRRRDAFSQGIPGGERWRRGARRAAAARRGGRAVQRLRARCCWSSAPSSRGVGARVSPVRRRGRARRMSSMRIALVSPYSWTYPGGVTRHIEALADQFLAEGHDVRVLAPYDPPDRWRPAASRCAPAGARGCPSISSPLGRTVGFPANGAVSNLRPSPPYASTPAPRARRRRLRRRPPPRAGRAGRRLGRADVAATLPLVGTFHTYSTNAVTQQPRDARRARGGG